MKNMLFLLLPAISLLTACTSSSPEAAGDQPTLRSYFTPVEEGVQDGGVQIIPITTPLGPFNVWTKRFGNNPKIKVLLLHGGPGATHEYFECVENFFPAEGIEFIYYDQLGSGNSDHPTDDSLWETARFVEEVEQVRQALNLTKDNFYLLGHSWGGILAVEYALKYQANLKGLIISNMMASAIDYDRYAEEVLAPQMNPQVLDTIRTLEAAGDFENPKYMELLMPNYYAEHILRLPMDAWPDPVLRAFNKLNGQVYVTMQGPSEFGISGKLETWDRKADLPKIEAPTLTVGARYDTMDPKHMEWMATQVKQGRYLNCPNGSHMCMYDDQQTWMDGVIRFILDVDQGTMNE